MRLAGRNIPPPSHTHFHPGLISFSVGLDSELTTSVLVVISFGLLADCVILVSALLSVFDTLLLCILLPFIRRTSRYIITAANMKADVASMNTAMPYVFARKDAEAYVDKSNPNVREDQRSGCSGTKLSWVSGTQIAMEDASDDSDDVVICLLIYWVIVQSSAFYVGSAKVLHPNNPT